MPEEKIKNIGLHTLKIKKYLSPEGDNIICEMGVNEELKNLLKYYAVTSKPKQEVSLFGSFPFKRYLIKNVLKSSIPIGDVFSVFFTEDIIKNGLISISLPNRELYGRFIDYIQTIRDLIRTMEELKQEESVSIEVKVRKAED